MANRKDRTRSTKSIKPPAPYQLRREDPDPVAVPVRVPAAVADPLPPPPLPPLDLLRLPTPDEISGDHTAPTSLAPPPGRVPAGDSRSLRRGDDFALVYRHHTHVITRIGAVGTHGHWLVINYPTPTAASHAYAVYAAHLHDDGFVDYAG